MGATKNNVTVLGQGPRTILMAHGFGCDQNMWRFLTPAVQDDYQVVLFDYVGSGGSDPSYFDAKKYASLEGYAGDVIDVCAALKLKDVYFIGHSVSAMIGLIASIKEPALFAKMVMICPSPCFLNFPPTYFGGFERADLEELLALMDINYIGWANYLGAMVMGANAPDQIAELSDSFCSTDPRIAKVFAQATFYSDCRDLLPKAQHPTLILQSSTDALAAVSVGEYVHAHLPNSRLELVAAEGHCLHMTHSQQVAQLVRDFCPSAA